MKNPGQKFGANYSGVGGQTRGTIAKKKTPRGPHSTDPGGPRKYGAERGKRQGEIGLGTNKIRELKNYQEGPILEGGRGQMGGGM